MVKKNLKSSEEAFGIIGLTLGIISVALVGSNGIVLALVGLIFSAIQQKKHPTKIGKAGVIVNIVGIILAIIVIVLLLTYLKPILEQQFTSFPGS